MLTIKDKVNKKISDDLTRITWNVKEVEIL